MTQELLGRVHRELLDVLNSINQDKIHHDGDDFHELLNDIEKALAQPEQALCDLAEDGVCETLDCPNHPIEQEPVKWSDYEPDGMHHNKPQKRPQNCGTGYCSCIECVMEPPQRTWVDVPDEEIKILWIQYRAALPRYLCFAKALLARVKEKNT